MSAAPPPLPPIRVVGAVASGATPMSAFHRALGACHVEHFNLVRLSSVIPPGVHVEVGDPAPAVPGGWGDRLYCVYAEQRTIVVGEEAWAAVGWVQRTDGTGGFFVEHEGGSEGFVRDAVARSLADMVDHAPDEFTPPQMVVAGGRCEGPPFAALVVAPYLAVPWAEPWS